jgi:hypothetical protein
MLIICAWCRETISNDWVVGGPVSHGICHLCFERMKKEIFSARKVASGVAADLSELVRKNEVYASKIDVH